MSDESIREQLREIDSNEEIECTSWEADFLDHVLFKYDGPLSTKQKDVAQRIIQKYWGK